jgi:superfamily I DNA/RNA helicase
MPRFYTAEAIAPAVAPPPPPGSARYLVSVRYESIYSVDEYQDTNRLQSQILLRLKPEGRGLMVVGDDAQSIYSFRAATVRNILDFPNQFQPAADIVTLEQNYLCGRQCTGQPRALLRSSGIDCGAAVQRRELAFES